MTESQRKAVVLLSGGLDSTTTLAIAKDDGFALYALSFEYGQRSQAVEISAAGRVAQHFEVVRHVILTIDLRAFGGSALTGDSPIPRGRSFEEISHGIPVTYVPARNTIFLSFALGWAEVLDAADIFIGVHATDYSGYPDCRPEYVAAFERMANLATKAGVEGHRHFRIHTPLIQSSKTDIVRRGLDLGVDYSMTMSCYEPSPTGEACGECDACRLRLRAFAEVGARDPAPYRRGGRSPMTVER